MMGLRGKKLLKTENLHFGNSRWVPILKEIDFSKFGGATAKSKFQECQIFLKSFQKGVPRWPKSDFVAGIKEIRWFSGAGGSNHLRTKCYTFLESGGLPELISEEKK